MSSARRKSLNSARKERLNTHAAKFREGVTPSELLPHLTCLPKSAKEGILRKEDNNGATRAAYEGLLMNLPRYDNWFEQLIPALRECHLNELANLLDDDPVNDLQDDHQYSHRSDQRRDHRGDPQGNRQDDRRDQLQDNTALSVTPHRPRSQMETGQPRPAGKKQQVTGQTLYKHLPSSVLEILRRLDAPSPVSSNDWKGLAAQLGYNVEDVEQLKMQMNPTEALLTDWSRQEDATLQKLMEALTAIQARDIYDQLQKKFDVNIEHRSQLNASQKGVSTASVSRVQPHHPVAPPTITPSSSETLSDGSDEAKVVIIKPTKTRPSGKQSDGSAAAQSIESVADGVKQKGNPRKCVDNQSNMTEKESKRKSLGTDQDIAGHLIDEFAASRAPSSTNEAGAKGHKENANAESQINSLSNKAGNTACAIDAKTKDTVSESMPVNNLNRNPHAIKRNITGEENSSSLELCPRKNTRERINEDNLRDENQQSSNTDRGNQAGTLTQDSEADNKNTASGSYKQMNTSNKNPPESDQSALDSVDADWKGNTLQSHDPTLNNPRYEATGPDDYTGDLHTDESLDAKINLQMSDASFPSNAIATLNGTSPVGPPASASSFAKPDPNATLTPCATTISSATPTLPATGVSSATPCSTATTTSSTIPISSTGSTFQATSTYQANLTQTTLTSENHPHVQKSVKGTPVTQPVQKTTDLPDASNVPSIDGTFSEDSLMVATGVQQSPCDTWSKSSSDQVSTQSPQGKAAPEPKENVAPKHKEIAAPEPKENAALEPKENTAPEPKGNTAPKHKENTVPDPKENAAPKPKESTVPEPKENAAPEPKESTVPEPKENADPEPKENAAPERKENAALEPQEVAGQVPTWRSVVAAIARGGPGVISFLSGNFLSN